MAAEPGGQGADVAGRPSQPFRPFFALAALDAMLGVLPWLVLRDPPGADWHRDELLFGMVPAVMAGFLLTALPRWTRTAPVTRAGLHGLVGFWSLGRLAHLGLPELAPTLSAGFLLAIAAILGHRIAATRKRREYKVVALLFLLAMAPLLPAGPSPRIALAAVLGLVAIIAGRIVPALGAAYLAPDGRLPASRPAPALERAAALALAAALLLWSLGFGTGGLMSGLAAMLQGVRLMSWRGWRVARHPGLLALHLAYLCLPVGLALLASAEAGLAVPGRHAEIHLWSTGALGLMCLAVMASMIRRQTGRPFANAAGVTAALGFGAAAVPLRLLAQVDAEAWLAPAAACWIAAFGFFLATFGPDLLRPGGGTRAALSAESLRR